VLLIAVQYWYWISLYCWKSLQFILTKFRLSKLQLSVKPNLNWTYILTINCIVFQYIGTISVSNLNLPLSWYLIYNLLLVLSLLFSIVITLTITVYYYFLLFTYFCAIIQTAWPTLKLSIILPFSPFNLSLPSPLSSLIYISVLVQTELLQSTQPSPDWNNLHLP
jgi:hypothetical protein